MGDNEYAIGISATGGDQAAGEIDKPANSLKGLSGAHGDLATQLGKGLDTSGFKMVSHEMLNALGLGGQMRAMYPLITMAENEMNTGLLALGGSMATVTMGATLLISGLVFLYDHMKQNKVVIDDSITQYQKLGDAQKKQAEIEALMASPGFKNSQAQIAIILEQIAVQEKLVENYKLVAVVGQNYGEDMEKNAANLVKAEKAVVSLTNALKLQEKVFVTSGDEALSAGKKQATASEQVMSQKLAYENKILISKGASTDEQIGFIRKQAAAELVALESAEDADKNKTQSTLYYSNKRQEIINKEIKDEQAIRDKANKWWVDATAQSAEIVAQAIGQSAFQSNVSWQSASVNIVSALAGATEKMISLTIAADIASMNFVGAAIAAAQYATVEAVKGWATRQIGGDSGSTGSSLASGSASPATSSPATSPSSSGVQATGVQSSAPVNYNQTTNIYAGAFVGDQATMRQFISEIWKQSWVLMNQGQIPKVQLA